MTHCNFLPNVGPGTDACCKQHDADYDRSGVSRRAADSKLLECLKRNGNPWWKRRAAYLAVRMFGWIFYKGK